MRESFWNVYRPGCTEHYVLNHIRKEAHFVDELDYVLTTQSQDSEGEKTERIIGQIAYVEAHIETDDGHSVPVLTMGPLSIHPEYQGKGYGQYLLDYSLIRANELGYGAVCIEGDISFYKNSGFRYGREYSIHYPHVSDKEASFFLVNELEKGYLDDVTGVYRTPQVYFVDESNIDAFDAGFPPKEKKVLPGQLFSE